MRSTSIGLMFAATVLAGCVAPPKYSWGNYEGSLYAYYKDPSKAVELATALEKNIQAAEQSQRPVAPGLYAEYGYLLVQQGKAKEAVPYFEKEKAKWPESAHLMNSMIQMASNADKRQAGVKE